jgi:hypothetical protein
VPEIRIFRNCSVDRASPVHHGPTAIAALRSSPEVSLRLLWCPRGPTKGWGGEGRAGEFNDGVAAVREAVEGRLTGGGASAQKGGGEGTLRAKRRSVGGVGVFTEGGGEAGEVGCLQWSALKKLQCPRIEGASYRGLKRGNGAA